MKNAKSSEIRNDKNKEGKLRREAATWMIYKTNKRNVVR